MVKHRAIISVLFLFPIASCGFHFDYSSEMDNLSSSLRIRDTISLFVDSFLNKYDSCSEKDAFLFFSDPHLLGSATTFSYNEKLSFQSAFESMRFLYDALPLDFCLCGGDWLNNHDTQDAAREKLLYADNKMKQWFVPYYKLMGNHDTNYQGVVSENDSSRGDLPYDFINNVYYSTTGKSYYTVIGSCTLFIFLDSGIDWEPAINDYRKQQLEWLSSVLQTGDNQHVVIGLHMIYYGPADNHNLLPMSKILLEMCDAFNRRDIYDSNIVKCDFKQAQGKVHFVLGGHSHMDFEYEENGIPCIGITNFISNGQPSFDICLINYDSGYLDMIRVGEGQNRRILMTK